MEDVQLSFELGTRRTVYSVSELASGLREVVEAGFDDVHVEGELSNVKAHRSGHCYFTLKDDQAQLRCVLWRHFSRYLFFEPKDGMRVRVRASASVYEARGDLQLVVRSMRLAGEGALQQAFDALKKKLDAEGLFAPERKRELPVFPRSIGVVTSGDGAALHDILTVLRRRFPAAGIVVCPVQVQGLGSAHEIARGIRCLNRLREDEQVDVMIVGRGGGSVEDLWAFNEEVVARAIVASEIPVVSAVGHETDYSIADLVADVRAATPSMAAELVAPDQQELRIWLRASRRGLASCLERTVVRGRQRVESLTRSRGMHRPVDRLRQYAQRVDDLTMRLEREARRQLTDRRRHAESLTRQLELLDPSLPLERGYARVERGGRIISRAAELAASDDVVLRFRDGLREARIVR